MNNNHEYPVLNFKKTFIFIESKGFSFDHILSYNKQYLFSNKKTKSYQMRKLNLLTIEIGFPFFFLFFLTIYPQFQNLKWKENIEYFFPNNKYPNIYNSNIFLLECDYKRALKKIRLHNNLSQKDVGWIYSDCENYDNSKISKIENSVNNCYQLFTTDTFFRICNSYKIDPLKFLITVYKEHIQKKIV